MRRADGTVEGVSYRSSISEAGGRIRCTDSVTAGANRFLRKRGFTAGARAEPPFSAT